MQATARVTPTGYIHVGTIGDQGIRTHTAELHVMNFVMRVAAVTYRPENVVASLTRKTNWRWKQ